MFAKIEQVHVKESRRETQVAQVSSEDSFYLDLFQVAVYSR